MSKVMAVFLLVAVLMGSSSFSADKAKGLEKMMKQMLNYSRMRRCMGKNHLPNI